MQGKDRVEAKLRQVQASDGAQEVVRVWHSVCHSGLPSGLFLCSIVCLEKKVHQAYYQICRGCAEGRSVCAKCGKEQAVVEG